MISPPVALVTGGSRGIGRGIAIELAKVGYRLLIHYVNHPDAARETQERVMQEGAQAQVVQGDVANRGDRQRIMEETFAAFGRLDLLVNNAGIAPRVRADLLEMSEASYREVMETNLTGPIFLTQLAARRMAAQQSEGEKTAGRIVFITSISAYTSSISRGEYCLSKAGLSMAVKLFADRLARDRILVYEVRPGVIATDMTVMVKEKYDRLIAEGLTPQPRWGTPEDVGRAVAAIAEGKLDFSTGAVIDVDGGFQLRRL